MRLSYCSARPGPEADEYSGNAGYLEPVAFSVGSPTDGRWNFALIRKRSACVRSNAGRLRRLLDRHQD